MVLVVVFVLIIIVSGCNMSVNLFSKYFDGSYLFVVKVISDGDVV